MYKITSNNNNTCIYSNKNFKIIGKNKLSSIYNENSNIIELDKYIANILYVINNENFRAYKLKSYILVQKEILLPSKITENTFIKFLYPLGNSKINLI